MTKLPGPERKNAQEIVSGKIRGKGDEQVHAEKPKGRTGRAKLGTGRTHRESCRYKPKSQGASRVNGHLWALIMNKDEEA